MDVKDFIPLPLSGAARKRENSSWFRRKDPDVRCLATAQSRILRIFSNIRAVKLHWHIIIIIVVIIRLLFLLLLREHGGRLSEHTGDIYVYRHYA